MARRPSPKCSARLAALGSLAVSLNAYKSPASTMRFPSPGIEGCFSICPTPFSSTRALPLEAISNPAGAAPGSDYREYIGRNRTKSNSSATTLPSGLSYSSLNSPSGSSRGGTIAATAPTTIHNYSLVRWAFRPRAQFSHTLEIRSACNDSFLLGQR